jgi:hypothetical protein
MMFPARRAAFTAVFTIGCIIGRYSHAWLRDALAQKRRAPALRLSSSFSWALILSE